MTLFWKKFNFMQCCYENCLYQSSIICQVQNAVPSYITRHFTCLSEVCKIFGGVKIMSGFLTSTTVMKHYCDFILEQSFWHLWTFELSLCIKLWIHKNGIIVQLPFVFIGASHALKQCKFGFWANGRAIYKI